MVTVTRFVLNGCPAEITLTDNHRIPPMLKVRQVSGTVKYTEIDETTANLLLQLRTGFDNRTIVIG
jgi:hypothetical protein